VTQRNGLTETGNDEDAAASVGKMTAESVGKFASTATSSLAEVAVASVFEDVSNIDININNSLNKNGEKTMG